MATTEDPEPITLAKEAVPFVISFRKVFKRPKLDFVTKFVGLTKTIKNIAAKVSEFVDEVAFEHERVVIDPGEVKSIHWAINVREPWDATTGETEVTATTYPGYVPPCVYHFEILQQAEHPPTPAFPAEPPADRASNPGADRIRSSLNRHNEDMLGANEP